MLPVCELPHVDRAHSHALQRQDRKSHYRWLSNEAYAEAFTNAGEQAADQLEEEARRRAQDGVDEPIFYQGKECGTVRRYSDTLLIFLLKGVRPGKNKDRIEQRIKRQGVLGNLSDEELETIARAGQLPKSQTK